MGSFPETYNGPNRLPSKRRLYSTKASKAFPIELFERKLERERAKKEEWGGRGGGGEKRKRFPVNPTIL